MEAEPPDRVGVRELRQNLSRYLECVKTGEVFVVTERNEPVARVVPFATDAYEELVRRFHATAPVGRLEETARRLRAPGAPAGTTDAFLSETRRERMR